MLRNDLTLGTHFDYRTTTTLRVSTLNIKYKRNVGQYK